MKLRVKFGIILLLVLISLLIGPALGFWLEQGSGQRTLNIFGSNSSVTSTESNVSNGMSTQVEYQLEQQRIRQAHLDAPLIQVYENPGHGH